MDKRKQRDRYIKRIMDSPRIDPRIKEVLARIFTHNPKALKIDPDIKTEYYAQAPNQQECIRACTEGHTYLPGCLLERTCHGQDCGDCMACGYRESTSVPECGCGDCPTDDETAAYYERLDEL